LLSVDFLCCEKSGGRRNIWLRFTAAVSESEEELDVVLDAGEDTADSVVAGRGAMSNLREDGALEVRKERWTGWRGEGGRKCLLCVTVFVDGVRDNGGAFACD
jgi:hypothetical protein